MNLLKIKNKTSSSVAEHLLLVAVLASISGFFVHQSLLWRWDNLLYDAQLAFWSRTVSEDIIIIAIDDESLNDIGRWPWSRSTHAHLINKIEEESPRVIGLDIIFSEPDNNNPLSDVLLSRAMRASGKVVLPVFMSQESSNSYPIEDLPLPEFTHYAAALGHVHIEIDDDGIARRVFLKEGIGKPHWLHYSLALLSVTDEAVELEKAVNSEHSSKDYSSLQWSREYPYLIPYAGPPGHVQHIGYSQVLSGEYPKELFKDKIVLIGTTAEGLGDAQPTPLSGNNRSMSGVEIIANVIDAILNGLRITEISTPWLILVTVIMVALPVLIYPFLNPVHTLLVLSGFIIGTVVITAMLLWFAGIWIPISTILLFQFLSYPLWSWRRLVLAMRHIEAEIDKLSTQQKQLSLQSSRNIAEEIKFISQFIPIKGWVVLDEERHSLIENGIVPVCNLRQINTHGWSIDGYRYWANTCYKDKPCILGLSIGVDTVITDEEIALLDSLIEHPEKEISMQGKYTGDVLQNRISQVQSAGRKYEELRRIIDDSLSGMADGILICSCRGQVLLSNRRAGWYLFGDDNAALTSLSLNEILGKVKLKDGDNWNSLLQKALFKRERLLADTHHEDGRDLMVEISPLRIIGDAFDGLVFNFSDISLLKASERKRNELLNFLSHDLRSPLSSMIAMIELARNKNSVEEMRDMMENMEHNTHKTLHLAEQFLQLSRANTSENILFYDIDFNSVVLNAIDQLWALSHKMNIIIEHTFDRDELWTHAEPDLLERAIINLLSNALKHSKENSVVFVQVQLINAEIKCCVTDHGSGITIEELPHLFEMFRRTRETGESRSRGIGLGLAFVDAVARRHGGHVDVESKLDEGSSFCLRIPHIEPDQILQS